MYHVSSSGVPWTVEVPGETVAAFVKARSGEPWSRVKKQIETGKVFVDGGVVTDVAHRVAPGQVVEVRLAAPRPRDPLREAVIVHEDAHVVVIDKPAGVSSVPYEDREGGTAMDLVRAAWRRMGRAATAVPLHVVHRIDRATSGLLVFATSKRAELGLAAQLRAHTMERTYRCVAHGAVTSRRVESRLVADRGDGLRGSTRHAGQGKRAVTHVTAVEPLACDAEGGAVRTMSRGAGLLPGAAGATLCDVRLETGKTHQIRIHLAEAGHPLVGETVYVRDYAGPVIASPRLLLHAATLGFAHPITGAPVALSAPLPADFVAVLDRLRRRG